MPSFPMPSFSMPSFSAFASAGPVVTDPSGTPAGRSSRAASPPAVRLRRPRWRDARLWMGVLVMVGAMLVGAWLMRPSADSVRVWRATTDLAVGALPQAEPVTASLGSAAGSYVPAGSALRGRMRLAVPEGALIPSAAIGPEPPGDLRLVTVPVDPQHAPVDLSPGAVVDVWSTPRDAASAQLPVAPQLVSPRTLVSAVGAQPSGMTGTLSVVLEVPAKSTAQIVGAARTGELDLILVPLDTP